jgi:multidrug efflux pump
LIISGGAGAEMRRSLGVAVFCGMVGVTLFGIFLTPAFYYMIRRLVSPPSGKHNWLHTIATLAISAALGVVLGLLLWRSTALDLLWAEVIGGGLALLAGAVAWGWRKRRGGRVVQETQE